MRNKFRFLKTKRLLSIDRGGIVVNFINNPNSERSPPHYRSGHGGNYQDNLTNSRWYRTIHRRRTPKSNEKISRGNEASGNRFDVVLISRRRDLGIERGVELGRRNIVERDRDVKKFGKETNSVDDQKEGRQRTRHGTRTRKDE